jgi:antitoxin (DNA-binding transcriptional repressor) of toxin-antitoxin stability system
MKMGIKEFREKVSEVSLGDQLVVVTHHGRRVGRFVPERPKPVDVAAWVREREDFARRWREKTPDWQERLRAAGIGQDAD